LAWVFDLNFTASLELLQKRSYIEGLAETLPRRPEITEAVDSVREYANSRIFG
jgi:hypothetical protein